ncbi:hypothetical protein HY468_04550 [Candidatus Roizmanbacteria bacterium]|nr:hypothetical protein [Candidatus Roizmanbacteria bacterium]
MQTITTTELRTKTKQLVEAMLSGKHVSLIHRSHVIGTFEPRKEEYEGKVMTKQRIKKLKKLIDELALPHLNYEERERRYRKHIEEKYGSSIS